MPQGELAEPYEPWRTAVIESTKDISEALLKLSLEVEQIRNVSLQNGLALDILLSTQGGTCALIRQKCCVLINDTSEDIKSKAEHLEQIAEDLDRKITMEIPSWIKTVSDKFREAFSWIPNIWGWFKSAIRFVVIVVAVLICCTLRVKCVKCAKLCGRRCKFKVNKYETDI